MANGYIVLEDAAKELAISEEELKRLMDDGTIRHFMDAGKIKFRRSDLDVLKTSLGIAEEEGADITLAPPDDLPELPEAEEMPPPLPVEPAAEEITVEPLQEEDGVPTAVQAAIAASGEREVAVEEEIASLSEFEIGEELEEEGEEISEEEAQLLSVETPGFRTYEEPQAASVGITVAMVVAIVLIAFGVVTLMSFVMGHNPFSGLTGYFTK